MQFTDALCGHQHFGERRIGPASGRQGRIQSRMPGRVDAGRRRCRSPLPDPTCIQQTIQGNHSPHYDRPRERSRPVANDIASGSWQAWSMVHIPIYCMHTQYIEARFSSMTAGLTVADALATRLADKAQQPFTCRGDRVFLDVGNPQQQASPGLPRLGIPDTQGHWSQATRQGLPGDFAIILALGQWQEQCQPGHGVMGVMGAQGRTQQPQAGGIQSLHSPQVTQVVPAFHEGRDRQLGGHGRRWRQHGRGIRKAIGQRSWHDHEPQAQCGAEGLAEGADMDHAPLPIQRGQCRRSLARQLQLTEVIILDDPAVAARCPLQQRVATRQGQGHAQRCLLPRRHQGHGCLGRLGDALLDLQPLLIHRDRHDPDARLRQGNPGQRVARFFKPGIAVAQGQPVQCQAQRPGIARGHQDLVGRTHQPSGDGQVGGDLLAQSQFAPGVGIIGRAVRRLARRPNRRSAPQGVRKGILCRDTHLKQQRRVAECLHEERGQRPAQPGGLVVELARWQVLAHIGARGATCDQQLLVDQALVGRTHGATRHAQLGGQVTPGWHARTGIQLPVANGIANTKTYLFDQRQPGVAVERNANVIHATRPSPGSQRPVPTGWSFETPGKPVHRSQSIRLGKKKHVHALPLPCTGGTAMVQPTSSLLALFFAPSAQEYGPHTLSRTQQLTAERSRVLWQALAHWPEGDYRCRQ
uniref:Uncharacterized protein n=1 Tax=biofilter metagenome TaxID=1070537 RepID=A0A193SBV4_9ZZZZ